MIGNRLGFEAQVRYPLGTPGRHGTGHINQVRDHGGSRRFIPRARPVVHGLPHRIAIHEHGVQYPVDLGDQVVHRHQCGMDAQLDPILAGAGDTEVLDPVAQCFRMGDVVGRNVGDALGVGPVELQRHPKGGGGHDGQLMGSIGALDIEGGIRFRVPQVLSFLQDLIEVATGPHLGEDVVAGAVDDAREPVDTVGRQSFADRLDDRDATGNTGFIGHNDVLLARGLKDLVAVNRDQGLVGRHNMLALFDGGQDQPAGFVVTADKLHHNVDGRVVDHIVDVRGERRVTQPQVRARTPTRNTCHAQIAARATSNDTGVALQDFPGTATDSPETADSDVHVLQLATSQFDWKVHVSAGETRMLYALPPEKNSTGSHPADGSTVQAKFPRQGPGRLIAADHATGLGDQCRRTPYPEGSPHSEMGGHRRFALLG